MISQNPARLELVVAGLDHTTAPIELRERLAFTAAEIRPALERLTGPLDPLFEQAAILSTCNRVEVYGVARSRVAREDLESFLARYKGIDQTALQGALYFHRGDRVAHHLAATAAGMHSLVLGEAQIQGQVRTALEQAMAAGAAGPELRRLFESAIAAGRRVRSRTALGRGVASVPQASVEFARRRLGTLGRSTVLLIGAGTTAELAAKHVARHGAGQLLVVGRDLSRAEGLAQRYGGRALSSKRLGGALALSDVVISATGAPHPIVTPARLGQRTKPLLVIDLSVPRDVEPVVAALPGVEVYAVDDLRELVEQTLVQRSSELPAARSVLSIEVARFTGWLRRREARSHLTHSGLLAASCR